MTKKRRFGVIEFSVVRSAERLDDDWNFIWLEGEAPGIIGVYNMSKDEYDAASHDPDERNKLLNMLHVHRMSR